MSSSELCRVLRSRYPMPRSPIRAQQRRDRGALVAREERVLEVAPAVREREVPVAQSGGDRGHRLLEVQRELLLAELAHQRRLFLDHDQLALVHDADAVGHLLGLVDVVRGQDDGDAALAQAPHQRPHVAAQLDVDPGGRLVEEQDLGLVRERLRDQHPPLHPARQRHDLVVALLPQREVAQHALEVRRVRRAAEETAAERNGAAAPTRTCRCAAPAAPARSSTARRGSRARCRGRRRRPGPRSA